MEDKRLIDKYYEITKSGSGDFMHSRFMEIRNRGTNKIKYVPLRFNRRIVLMLNDTPVAFTSPMELFRVMFNVTEDEISYILNGYGLKTKEYLTSLGLHFGFVEWTTSLPAKKGETVLVGEDEFIIYSAGPMWVAYTLDGESVLSFTFVKKPSIASIKLVRSILEADLLLDNLGKDYFYCPICGEYTHFADMEGDIEGRIKAFKNYCCCC